MPEIASRYGAILFDEEDAAAVHQHRWYTAQRRSRHGIFYAQTSVQGTTLYMHRMIAKPAPGLVVDHINSNGLDNRRGNLRAVTRAINSVTARSWNPKSGYRGVYRDQGLWVAQLWVGGKCNFLGRYKTSIEAAAAYNVAAERQWGSFARLNDLSSNEGQHDG